MDPAEFTWDDLPKYDHPPVTEIAIGVEFVPAPQLTVVELVKLHLAWEEQFPRAEEQPLLPPAPAPGASIMQPFQIQFGGGGQIRLWLLSADAHLLVQVQHDRFVLNWRRLGDDADYPSYAELRDIFVDRWRAFLEEVSGRVPIRPTVADVTFVNSIAPGPTPDLSPLLASAKPVELPQFASLQQARLQYLCAVEPGNNLSGQLVVTVEPSAEEGQVLTVITRLGLQGEAPDTDDILVALDSAHASSVLGFTDITSTEMHQTWGRSR